MSAAAPLIGLSPLSAEQSVLLERLVQDLDPQGLWWLSGYVAGLACNQRNQCNQGQCNQGHPPSVVQAIDPDAIPRLSVVYGSQTGNAKRLAEALAAACESEGVPVRLLRADAYPARELKHERYLAVVISTQGDGDPPDDARALVEFIESKRAPRLPQLRFAVLGLGDSSYPQFCAIGQRLDARLEALGAQRWIARGDADLDIDTVAAPWSSRLFAQAKDILTPRPPLASVTPLRPPSAPAPAAWSRERPFAAEVLAHQRITGRGSDRDIRHLELSLAGSDRDESGLAYEPGDALGVRIENPPELVRAIIDALGLNANATVAHGDETRSLREWLTHQREITRLSRPFLAAHAQRSRTSGLDRLLDPKAQDPRQRQALNALLAREQIIDLLATDPGDWNAEDLVAVLRPLQPRLYSIASSRKMVGEEAHLTVAHVEYHHGGALRWGAGSHWLALREEGGSLPVFIERNERFRLPTDSARDVIMVGPGTGVAPFRGFVQEREAIGAHGRNWLLFGNPHARSDFLYQLEWQDALKRGALHRLDLAFSRDQAGKVYVQHRLREHARDVFDWLENGAHLYVCGDAARMAKDVHAALIEVIATQGARSAEDAAAYLHALQAQGRYARDVY
ncbi:MAG: assimilatory sulfite reductase (NADPH) flavoprotein subunit [Lysobacteraceae bacterium]|nr:MAG: assimilatory sulfite reductase (NADPH) flavoprotein subunit [Xanthomonadaceae bacterium]